MIAGLWFACRRIGRGPLAAALIFVGVLVPALGFFNVYPFRLSFVADHYQYHASIALIALAAAGVWLAVGRLPQWAGALAVVGLLLPLAIVARARTHVYFDNFTLHSDTVAQNPGAFASYNNLGVLLLNAGDYDRAATRFREAIEANPGLVRLHVNLASAADGRRTR